MTVSKEEKIERRVASILRVRRDKVHIKSVDYGEGQTVVFCKQGGWDWKIVIPKWGLPITYLMA